MTIHKKIRVGVYGIAMQENKVLMVRTQSGSKLIYNFPGGGIEVYEIFIDSLKRECREELGTDVQVSDLLYVSEKVYAHDDFPDYLFFGLYYAITLQGPIDYDLHGARWLCLGDLCAEALAKEEAPTGEDGFDINNLPMDEMLPMDKNMVSKVLYSTNLTTS